MKRSSKHTATDLDAGSIGRLTGTRRQLVGASLIGVAALAISQAQAETARAEPVKAATAIKQMGDDVVSSITYSPDFTQQFALSVPRTIQVTPVGSAASTVALTLAYDPRAFSMSDRALYTRASTVHAAEDVAERFDALGRTIVDFEISRGESGTIAGVQFAMPLIPVNNFPNENIGPTHPVTLTVKLDGEAAQSIEWAANTPTAVFAWGVELTAAWLPVDVRDAGEIKTYRYPILVRASSVGPSSAPLPSTITIDLDARIVKDCAIESASLDGSPIDPGLLVTTRTVDGDLARFEFRLYNELPASGELDIALTVTPQPSTAKVRELRYAMVRFSAPTRSGTASRDTGKYSVLDLTSSGNPQIDDVAEGSV